jgi:regulatory protein
MQRRSEQLIAALGMGLKTGLALSNHTQITHNIPVAAGHAAATECLTERLAEPCLEDLSDAAAPNPRSLKTRAVYYLSKREHSRAELAKKLAQPTYKARQKAFVHKTELPETPSPELIDSVLDDLQRQGFLDDERFAQGLARKNASKHGAARVMSSLGQHQLAASTTQQLAAQLKDSELPRCHDVWRKRFAHINRADMSYPESQAALGKQGRFLMQRGFAGDTIRKVLNGWQPESD